MARTPDSREHLSASSLVFPASEAEVIAIEAHPKLPGMYRVAVRLEHEHDGTNTGEEELHSPSDPDGDTGPEHWKQEVDALIASAQRGASAVSDTVITVHEDTLVSLRLLKGRRLSANEWDALRREEDLEDAYRAALSVLERKARTSKELSEALKRKDYAPDIIQACLKRLQDRRMLDDSSYARRYAEQKATAQRKGSRLIRQELLQRGIAKQDADEALNELDEGVEREAALALARKKWPQLKGEMRERKQKLAAFLLRRGYPSGIVRDTLQQVMQGLPSDDDEAEFIQDEDTAGSVSDWD